MAGHIRHVPIISHRHWVVVGCGLVDHASIPGIGANHGDNYSETPDRVHYQHRLLSPGIIEESGDFPNHLGLDRDKGPKLILIFNKTTE